MLLKGATRRPIVSLVSLEDQESQGEDSNVSSPDASDEECEEIVLGSSPEDCVAEFTFWKAKRVELELSHIKTRSGLQKGGAVWPPALFSSACSRGRMNRVLTITTAAVHLQCCVNSTSSTTSAAGSHLKLRYDLGDLLAGSRASGFLTGETATVADPVLENVAVEGAGRPASLLLDSYDLATQCPSRRATLRRRHTVATTATTEEDDTNVTNGTDDVPVKKVANVSDPERGEEAEEEEEDSRTHTSLGSCELNWSRSSLQDELLQSSHWQSAMECLSLTLEEIVHIRSVLTKAELESLPVEGRIKEEVEKRKVLNFVVKSHLQTLYSRCCFDPRQVCFLCLKTRFSIFGPWGQRCKLCKRTVCAKCCSKMRIPTEHFSRVPVFALSPGLSSPEGSEDGSNSPTFARSLMTRLLNPSASSTAPTATATSTPPAPQRYNSVGSAPTSPASVRRSKPGTTDPPNSMTPSPAHQQFHPTISPNIEEQPQSLPVTVNNKETSAQRGKLLRSKTLGRPAGVCNTTTAEKLKGLQMTVCLDCKAMVLQIIKTSRTSRTHAIKNLSLNLSPVY
ncbi:hypothetical protein B566_EDAN005372 [Ephemera danica]|nr:hypothetical protein B566_EDAN005372 [Ephemera danica]